MTAAEKLGAWAAGTSPHWSQHQTVRARVAIQDTLACIIAGLAEAVTQKVGQGAGGDTSLVLGTAAHALDYDDNFEPALAHASAVLVPALLVAGAAREKTLHDIIDAYLVGLQVMGHVGYAVNPIHRFRGFHASSTIGPIGAAAGVARLLGLSAAQTTHAISLAVSMASGTTEQFGTEAKPLHVGLATRAAINAAELAKAGVEGSASVLDGRFGFQELYAGDGSMRSSIRKAYPALEKEGKPLEFVLEELTQTHVIDRFPPAFKFFANCGSAHAIVELALENAELISKAEKIDIGLPTPLRNNLRFDRPTTGAEAKFSATFPVALIALGRRVDLSAFRDEVVAEDALQTRLDLMDVYDTGMPANADDGAKLTLTLNGQTTVLRAVWSTVRGTENHPASEENAQQKLVECWAYAQRSGNPSPLLMTLPVAATASELLSEVLTSAQTQRAAE